MDAEAQAMATLRLDVGGGAREEPRMMLAQESTVASSHIRASYTRK